MCCKRKLLISLESDFSHFVWQEGCIISILLLVLIKAYAFEGKTSASIHGRAFFINAVAFLCLPLVWLAFSSLCVGETRRRVSPPEHEGEAGAHLRTCPYWEACLCFPLRISKPFERWQDWGWVGIYCFSTIHFICCCFFPRGGWGKIINVCLPSLPSLAVLSICFSSLAEKIRAYLSHHELYAREGWRSIAFPYPVDTVPFADGAVGSVLCLSTRSISWRGCWKMLPFSLPMACASISPLSASEHALSALWEPCEAIMW